MKFSIENKLDINSIILYNNKEYNRKGGGFTDNFSEYFKEYFRKTDIWLWLFTIIATAYSLVLIGTMQRSGTYNYLFNQTIAIIIGIFIAVLLSLINYKYFIKRWYVFAGMGFFLAGLVFVFGVTVSGTDDTAWVKLPGGITFQPSEFIKLCFIITFSARLAFLEDRDRLHSFIGVMTLVIHNIVFSFQRVYSYYSIYVGRPSLSGSLWCCRSRGLHRRRRRRCRPPRRCR